MVEVWKIGVGVGAAVVVIVTLLVRLARPKLSDLPVPPFPSNVSDCRLFLFRARFPATIIRRASMPCLIQRTLTRTNV